MGLLAGRDHEGTHQMKTELGKITRACFGFGGYQGACIGLSLSFEAGALSTNAFEGSWDWTHIERSESTKWTEAERDAAILNAVRVLSNTLHKAKRESVSDLVGIPVELTFDQNRLQSWRVLEEVL